MTGDVPTWQDLDLMISRNGLSEQGIATAQWALGRLRTMLGGSWLARQYRKQGRLPSELLMAGVHRAAMPQALSFVLRLERAIAEPTFAPVRSALARGVDGSSWRHMLLQLEVARAAADQGAAVSFEPSIPGSTKKGDLLISDGTGPEWMVETTTVPRAVMDMSWHDYEDWFQALVRQVEHRHNVTCAVVLTDHMAEEETQDWLNAVELVAASAADVPGPQVVPSDIGAVTVYRGTPPPGTVTFTGAAQYRDGWHRLGRTLGAKAKQIAGPWPAWIRVDCLDGLFQFTEWARMAPEDRLDAIATEMRNRVMWPANADGVVLSSGPAVSIGATNPLTENVTVQNGAGAFLRRLISPHLVRETFVVLVRDGAQPRSAWWTRAYGSEPTWLDVDLSRAGQAHLQTLWNDRPPQSQCQRRPPTGTPLPASTQSEMPSVVVPASTSVDALP
ncbi:hypothetical protein [Micromonospora musae]|uniref:hypothetical protein n=1 Tax=Micromonospora musae TaxID=1894970 RepID=UPI0033F0CFE9